VNIDMAALRSLEREKDIAFDLLVEAIESALLIAYQRTEGANAHARAIVDRASGEVTVLATEMDDEGNAVREFDDTPTDFNRIGTTYTSLCGTVVRVEIERATGAVRIAKAYSVLECGQPLVPEVIVGQSQGGFAMGVGYALLESLPLYEDGPGNGKWNLGQYTVARASDLPLGGLEIEVLPPVSPDEKPKGMAEVVMIPVVPALLNAIFDATGHRFQSLPVTPAMLKGALT